jgi:excisionase family DNA binding protein
MSQLIKLAEAARPSISSPEPLSSQFLRAEEIASELKCSKPHVYKLIAGKVRNASPLPALQMGRCRRVRRSTFEEWKKQNERVVSDDKITPPELTPYAH